MHIHWPQTSEHRGVFAYETCRCGARRARRVATGYSAIRFGWTQRWSDDSSVPSTSEGEGT
jgi:hypothetical protein